MPDILNWLEIADEYSDSLLIGNGASIALHEGFSYPSLLQHAAAQQSITPAVQAIFDHLRTTDFELAMLMLWHAQHVNEALQIAENRTAQAYIDIRSALIAAVRDLHVDFADVSGHLAPIGEFIEHFKKVLSLNYDLTLYWSMLEANEAYQARRFKDCWLHGGFEDDWERLQEPIGTDRCTLVFYPHGNLVLASSPLSGEVKLSRSRSASNLLDAIFQSWQTSDWIPLFVSEGSSAQKQAAIARSGYLSTVYNDVMKDLGDSVVVFGWSMADNDEHILRRICGSGVRRIAISVYRGDRQQHQLDTHCEALAVKVRSVRRDINLQFFDSASRGCWNNLRE